MLRSAASAVLCLVVLAGCAGAGTPAPTAPAPPAQQAPRPVDARELRAEVVASGLQHGWEIGFLPDGSALVTQRPGRLALFKGGQVQPVAADFGDVLVEFEGGLMGMLIHPRFAENRRFITCQTHQAGGRAIDIRLITWRLADDGASAQRVGEPLLTGLPINPNGRHSGCRPALAADGALLVSTGDVARPATSQDRHGLGGKVLRMDIDTGAPLPDNPFASSPDPNERLLLTYGHRNPQGVAVRPGGQVLISEHGPDRDDEINLLRPGGNYGWDPSRGGTEDSYDEAVPMTDLRRFPDAVPAVWSSGRAREAPCGAEFLTGSQWGRFDGMLAVTTLRGSKLLLYAVNPDGSVRGTEVPAALDGTYGRLRAARQGPDGALYVTTSNGGDDKILRITAG
ncbi:PQQ-dependent sugar dehydrogenase [Saccharopolyspora erythraea]|uniref:PQQ-dependent sugar dehydrogenase n=1 Tax=Saccharopolyspora erythraea TaxID=1836 RepID=UPI001BA9201E|nr:PQQ-dependent sugar dehydrogenase [Saccharopolyspora erythraea]QUH00134.1 PQQ-dependent sugar dehydrogenase [Saccharopolyspora erythraea]